MAVRPNSQAARILRVLADGRWHTAAKLQRAAGKSRLNSRISELRKRHGYVIEHEQTDKAGALGHRYRLLGGPEIPPAPEETVGLVKLDRSAIPRTYKHRYRIYRQRYDELELVATAKSVVELGKKIVTLGRDGQFAGSNFGLLDTFGTNEIQGTWLVDPFDVSDARA